MWKVEELGIVDYQEALEHQYKLVAQKQSGLKEDYLLLLEHYPVYTMGKGADSSNILDKTINTLVINRRGDITYHGPGQLVCYIIMNLKNNNLDIHSYIRKIELLIINVLEKINISAYTINGLTGVWVENRKIASIGIGVKRGITMHGFALNLNPEMAAFNKINPCGLNPEQICSIYQIIKTEITMGDLKNIVIEKFFEIFV